MILECGSQGMGGDNCIDLVWMDSCQAGLKDVGIKISH